jgi:Domain of unknown function DUF29
MGKEAAYETDIVAWAEEQAALLRDIARHSPVSNQIDWDNVAEEIETVGRSETRAVASAIRLIFIHLIKLALLPQSPSTAHWRTEIVTWLGDLRDDFTPAMATKIDCQALWQRALREASSALSDSIATDTASLTPLCPFELNDLLDDSFDIMAALRALTSKSAVA